MEQITIGLNLRNSFRIEAIYEKCYSDNICLFIDNRIKTGDNQNNDLYLHVHTMRKLYTAVNSILNQTYTDFIYYILDNGSIDCKNNRGICQSR